jgi:serine/threonine protein phosphatase 1
MAADASLSPDSIRYPKRLKHFHEIFIGHTPTQKYGQETPIHAMNLWNLDTGAAFKGRLTAMDVDTKIYWQSEPVWMLYSGEMGRNGG